MKRILFLDFETNGLDMDNMNIIEFGGLITDEDYNIIETVSFLINSCEISEHITKLTGITNAMLQNFGVTKNTGYDTIAKCCDMADYIVAHNGGKFDFLILEQFYRKKENQVFIDTMNDLPIDYPTRKLTYLCAEYGITLNQAHRAINDVFSMYHLTRKFIFQDIIDNILQPKYTIIFKSSYPEMMKLAKELRPGKNGFNFVKADSLWTKYIKHKELEQHSELLKIKFYQLKQQ